MDNDSTDALQNIMPHFTHVIERICTSEWNIPPETFSLNNFVLVYEGEGYFHCNSKDFHAKKGDFIYYKAGDFRHARTSRTNPMKCFVIDFEYTCPIMTNKGWTLVNAALPFESLERIDDPFLFSKLLDHFNYFTKVWISSKDNYLLTSRAIFIEILKLLLLWKRRDGINYGRIRRVEKVINYMTDCYTRDISLSNLSEIAQVSPSYLIYLFKEVTGKSPVEYLIDIRINKAKLLLKEGHSVTKVGEMLGFKDIYHFSKCFKKRTGITPSEYRTTIIF